MDKSKKKIDLLLLLPRFFLFLFSHVPPWRWCTNNTQLNKQLQLELCMCVSMHIDICVYVCMRFEMRANQSFASCG